VTGHELAQRYEDLRSWALGVPVAMNPARGLALFLRRGLPAWMQTWVQHVPASPASPPAVLPTSAEQLPHALGLELARVLANMVLLGRGRART